MYFAEKIRERRTELELTAQDLADMLGVSRSYITLIEGGKRLPNKSRLPKLPEILKLDREVFFGWYIQNMESELDSLS